jgi:hypothetical protein
MCGTAVGSRPGAWPRIPPGTAFNRRMPSMPPGKKHGIPTWAIILIVVAVAVVVAVPAFVALEPFTIIEGSNVTALDLTSRDNVCGLNGRSYGGFSLIPGATFPFAFTLSNLGASSCTVNSVNATTPGFGVSGADVPLTLAAHGDGRLSLNLTAPRGTFDGVLTLDLE